MRRSFLLLLIACSSKREPEARDPFTRYTLDSPPGVSDLAIDDRGTLYAIPERDHVVLEIAKPGAPIVSHPLDGVPDGVDTEAIAWLSPGHFAIGTEGQDVASASVLYAELRADGHVAVTSTLAITGVPLSPNHGAEAMCGRGDDLWVAIEHAVSAPLVHVHAGKIADTRAIALTTDTGKIAALACTTADDIYAIERHYGVHRILHIRDLAHPTVALDLDPILHNSRNIEGIARLPDGRFVLVNDNQSRTVEGPTELLVLPAGAVQPRPCAVCSSRSSSRPRPRPRPTSSRSIR